MKCDNCGRNLHGESLFCSYCGTKVVTKRNSDCKNCGNALDLDALFCDRCGAGVEQSNGIQREYLENSNEAPQKSYGFLHGKRDLDINQKVIPEVDKVYNVSKKYIKHIEKSYVYEFLMSLASKGITSALYKLFKMSKKVEDIDYFNEFANDTETVNNYYTAFEKLGDFINLYESYKKQGTMRPTGGMGMSGMGFGMGEMPHISVESLNISVKETIKEIKYLESVWTRYRTLYDSNCI